MAGEPLVLDGNALSLDDVEDVARHGLPVHLADAARPEMERSRAVVESASGGAEAVYGVNTGFGSLANRPIDAAGLRQVQRNLIRSHAAGVGAALPEDTVRAMLVILAASLSRGRSGVRPQLVELILGLLNHGITPVVPSRGSVGASGDLAPLAHVDVRRNIALQIVDFRQQQAKPLPFVAAKAQPGFKRGINSQVVN